MPVCVFTSLVGGALSAVGAVVMGAIGGPDFGWSCFWGYLAGTQICAWILLPLLDLWR